MTRPKSAIPRITHFQVSAHWDSDEKIRLIETYPDADTIIVIWFKLLAMCTRQEADGIISFPPEIDMSAKHLAIMLNRPENTVKMALGIFESFGMINPNGNSVNLINWPKHQHFDALETIRAHARDRIKRFRERQQAFLSPPDETEKASNVKSNASITLPVTLRNAPEERRGEERREEKRRGEVTPQPPLTSTSADNFSHENIYQSFIEMIPYSFGRKINGEKELAMVRDFSKEVWKLGATPNMVQDAFKEAGLYNKCNLNYVRGVLKSWLSVEVEREVKNADK